MRGKDDFTAATLPSLDMVYNLARRMIRDPYAVEDLVQETYARAYQAWSSGRIPTKVEPWLATICLNLGRSWYRRAYNRRETPVEEFPATAADSRGPADRALERVTAGAVHEALWQLPEEQRTAIALMDLSGFSASEAGKIMGTSRNTVLSRVHRGRKKLARMLEQEVTHEEA